MTATQPVATAISANSLRYVWFAVEKILDVISYETISSAFWHSGLSILT